METMQTSVIEPTIFTGLPIFPIVTKKKERNNRSLTSLYRGAAKNYEIDCKYSTCRTKCVFHNSELGFVIFEREGETIIGSEKNVGEDYMRYLIRTLSQWKKHFNDFDIK